MHKYLIPLAQIFNERADPLYAINMKRYMKNRFEFFGIKSPERREFTRTFYRDNGLPDHNQLDEIVRTCWKLPQREFQYFAMELAYKFLRKSAPNDIGLYEGMITGKSWWDTVDYIAVRLAGALFRKYPDMIRVRTETWMNSENIWLQRSALLFQLHYKKDTDTVLLEEYISRLSGSGEFFIQKAIGWILREYSKTDPGFVVDFADTHQLKPLSRREALRRVNGGLNTD